MRRKIFITLLFMSLLILLSSCFAYYGPQMPLSGVWKSDTPNMYIDFCSPYPYNAGSWATYDEQAGEIFYQDGTRIKIEIVGFVHGDLSIVKYSEDYRWSCDDILCRGEIKWRSKESKNDTLVIIINDGGDIDGYTEIELKRVGDGVFYKEYLTRDEIYPTNALTKEYDISELKDYFEIDGEKRTISEVNERFPIELTRSNGYTLYKVKESGYYYVFWERPWSEIGDDNAENEPTVYSTLYLSKHYREEEEFDSIESGISTFADVLEIDPYAELIYRNGELCSYSFLNVYQVYRVEYTFNGETMNESGLTVKGIRIYDSRNASIKLSTLLFMDIPYEWNISSGE